LLAWVAPVQAQVLYASLVGNVVDPSQGAVPAAAVTVTNTATGLVRETKTDERGFFAFRDLLEGTYDLKITASGFRTYTRAGIPITINTITRNDVEMQIGQISESVTVGALAAVLQTDKSDVHVDLGGREVTNLPLAGYRNYQSLVNLVPGTTPGAYQNALIDTPARALTTNVNGASRNSNTTRVDGALNVYNWLPHHTLYVPPAESIETVNITTNSFDAEQGLAGGAAVNLTTKSGTNEFHGVLFEYHNNSAMAARNFFYVEAKKAKTIQNTYGATLGGPIRKDKLFFFTSWEALRNRVNASGFNTVPTADQRQGDFSALNVTLYDPQTGGSDGRGRQVFAGNRIPSARHSAIALKMQSYLPLPNQPGLSNNHFSSASVVFDRDNGDAKINFSPSAKLSVWGKYSIMDSSVTGEPRLGAAGGEGLGTGGSGTGHTLVQVAALGGTYTISPTLVVDGNLGFSRLGQNVKGPDYGQNFGLEVLGIPGTNGPDIRQSGMPIFAVSSYTSFGNPSTWSPAFRNDNTYSYTVNAGWTRGAHNVRWGMDIGRFHLNHWQPERGRGPRGQFAFTGGLTALNGGPAPNQFNSWADYLLGLVQNLGKSYQYMSPMSTRDWQQGLYFRDQWQTTRSLTTTLGLRWEYFPLMTRAHRGIERYDPDLNQTLIGGRGSTPRNAGTTVSKKLFAPRVGLAYRLSGGTVLRAGYGISIDPYPLGRPLRDNYPVVISQEISAPNTYSNAGRLETGIPAMVFPDESKGIVDIPGTVSTRAARQGEFNRGYIQSFNVTVQRQLPGQFTAQAGYVGTRSIRQFFYFNLNAGLIPGAGVRGQPLYLKYGRTADTVIVTPFSTVSYNSHQTKLDRRFSAGLMMSWAYTWSKAVNYQDNSTEGGWRFWVPGHTARNRAVAGYDREHNLQMSSVWEMPFGTGKPYANTGGLATALLGGWQWNAILSSYTGTPFSIDAPGTSLNAPGNSQTADQVKPEAQKLGGVGRGNPFFDPTAFRAVTDVRFGNSGRNILRGPGSVNLNLGLFRTFELSERWKLQFRAESFNATNTPHFSNPNASVTSTSFGIISATLGTAGEDDQRLFRVALRLSW
jgi:hypothetical protein